MNAPIPAIGTPGVFLDVPNDTYHRTFALSNTGLTSLSRSPHHFYALHLDPHRPIAPTKAGQLEGTLAHCAILEPSEFDRRYVVGPEVSRATKQWKEFEARHPGLTCIKPDQYDAAMRQAESVRDIREIAELLGAGTPEVSAWWCDPITGELCKCRPDWLHPAGDGAIVVDIKTCGDASPGDFARQIARKGYYRQAAWYQDGYAIASGAPVLAFVFVAVEATYPYSASAVMLDDAAIEQGRLECRRLLDLYARCKRDNHWPGYSNGIELVSLPRYLMDQPE